MKYQMPGLKLFLGFWALSSFLTACSFHRDKAGIEEAQTALEPTYASISKNIFQPKCFKCHAPPKPKHDIDLSTYNGTLGRGLMHVLVMPGFPEKSSLYTEVRDGKMPKKAARLSVAEVEAIGEWIRNGAREIEEGPPAPMPSVTPEPCDKPLPGEPPSSGDDC